MFEMNAMIPFYYALVALCFGIVGGFCARCYQINSGENYLMTLKSSAMDFAGKTRFALFLPVLVVLSKNFRAMLLEVMVYEAAKDYAISISEQKKDSLVAVLLERTSLYNVTKLAVSLSIFYFINLAAIANSTMKENSAPSGKVDSCEIRGKFFGKGISFYRNNIFARTCFSL